MLKTLYKIVGLIFTAFIIFIFMVNYNFMNFKEGIFTKIYFSIKINFIYYLFYLIYIFVYFKYFGFKKNKHNV